MPFAHTATEEMQDTLREGRFYVEPRMQHVLAMHLVALEWAEEVLIQRHAGARGPREIAAEAKARLRHAALVRSYRVREEERVEEAAAARVGAALARAA